MDCETSEPLIEALCDDELDVADAASLVAHLEGCAGCSAFRREVETRKTALQEARPVDRLPDEVRARLVREMGRSVPRRRRVTWAISAGLAAVGLLAGSLALRDRSPRSPALADLPVVQDIAGEVFCLRCALTRLFPETPVLDPRHLPILRTDEGEVITLLDGDVTQAALAKKGCAGRRVVLTVRFYPRQELAEVLAVRTIGPSSGLPPRDAVALAAVHAGSSPR
jgi:anti-sigma factor RsiW